MRITVDTVGFVRALIKPFGPWGELLFDRNDAFDLLLQREFFEHLQVLPLSHVFFLSGILLSVNAKRSCPCIRPGVATPASDNRVGAISIFSAI